MTWWQLKYRDQIREEPKKYIETFPDLQLSSGHGVYVRRGRLGKKGIKIYVGQVAFEVLSLRHPKGNVDIYRVGWGKKAFLYQKMSFSSRERSLEERNLAEGNYKIHP